MRTRLDLTWWIVACWSLCAAAAGVQDAPKLETLDQYTRLQLPVSSGSSFHLLNGKAGETTLVVDRVSQAWLEPLKHWSDARVQSVSVRPSGLDKAEITVRFRNSATESFAYLQGNTLVLDLWKQEKQEASHPNPPDVVVVAPKKSPIGTKKQPQRALASVKVEHPAKPESENAEKVFLKVEPLRIDRDLFQRFVLPMPELELSEKESDFHLPPKLELEGRWKFAAQNAETEEGKAFEFALKLFAMKKFGLCLKAIEILLRDHPDSPDFEELQFLQAFAYKRLGEATNTDFLLAKAEKILQELASKRDADGVPAPFQRLILLYFGEREYLSSNWLQAIGYMEAVSSQSSIKDHDFPYVQMLLAESYAKVNQPRRAERLFRYVTEKFPKHVLAKEAYYRIADLLAGEKNYHRAEEEGEAALRTYPEYVKKRPEVLFHVGEANFWLGNYSKAEKFFRRYVETASAQTNASLGWVRIGEIQEVQRSDLAAARESYLRAKNGYPFSKGDLVATVRMARIDLPREKEPGFVVKTLQEMLGDKSTDWELKRMAELTLSDYMLLTGELEKSLALAHAGMGQTEGQVYELYKRAFVKVLFTQLERLNHAKRFGEALVLFDREQKWLEQYGPDVFRTVAETYRGIGLFGAANKFMERYVGELAKGRGLASVSADPKVARAKAANNFARGDYPGTLEELAGLQDAESSYLRAIAEFRLGHKRDAYAAADKALAQAKAAKIYYPEERTDLLLEILLERDMAERDFRRMEQDIAGCRALLKGDSERIYYSGADALWYQKRHDEAAKAYLQAVEKFPQSLRKDRALYNRSMSLLAIGKREEAVKQLTVLKESGQGVWAESAKQELQLIEWEKKYASVLRTLPPSGLGISE